MAPDLHALFQALPQAAQDRLAIGSTGMLHLLETAGCCLAQGTANPAALDTGADMLLSALGMSPLSGQLASQILHWPGLADRLEPKQRALLKTLDQGWKRPENLSYFQRLAAHRDMVKLRRFLEGRLQEDENNLFWREQALVLAQVEGDPDFARFALDHGCVNALGPLSAAALRLVEYHADNHEAAMELAEQCAPVLGTGAAASFRAESLLALGERQEGLDALLDSLTASPWRTNSLLRAHDLLHGLDSACAPLRGQVEILLYTWNKADDLDAALLALAGSDLGLARITALNNGSTDHTARVLAKWQTEFGRDRLRIVELPVNIGAPAARNWLAHSEAADADLLVYLDDDALVPPDWLGRFGTAMQRYPEAGVWGCRVVDDAQPYMLQSVDYHLLPHGNPKGDVASGPDLACLEPHPIKLSNLHLQGSDQGQFSYLRPCASVTGCCHLFRKDRFLETGDFSLFLSPSQYDDMERDLRMLASGRLAVYQGHLRVRHRKRTGSVTMAPGAEGANALGNRYKMQVMHGLREMDEAALRERQTLLDDLYGKRRGVQEALEQRCAAEQD
ncbi:MAG: glycosyltransferase [Desulfovibrionaceae bacterium]